MKVRILTVAEAEVGDAVNYYNKQSPGLGFEFAAEVRAAITRISDFPDAWPIFSSRCRRCRLNRFPYGILYHRAERELLVLGVMHLMREPKSWQDRMKEITGEQAAPRKRRR